MIVSHLHRFIFLKTAKTAGTSIEAALAQALGPTDIIAGPSRPPWRPDPRSLARNHLVGLGRLGVYVPGSITRHVPQLWGFYPHMPGSQVRAMIGERVWNSYFKFTIERNPWDRQLSLFFFRHKRKKRSMDLTFETFLTSKWYTSLHSVRLKNWETYTIADETAVDRVLRFENVAQEFADVCNSLGIGGLTLPRENEGPKRDRHYRDYYTDKTSAVIRDWYRREIETFGYEF